MILMNCAPCRSSCRAARRTSSTPSATRPSAPKLPAQRFGSCVSCRGRRSAWPPDFDSALPHTISRGPIAKPCSTASAKLNGAPPTSRTVVKPRSSMPRMIGSDRSTAMASGTCALAPRFIWWATTCTWQSISPGISVRPRRSTTSRSGAAIGRAWRSRMTASSISTCPSRGSEWAASAMRALVSSVCMAVFLTCAPSLAAL